MKRRHASELVFKNALGDVIHRTRTIPHRGKLDTMKSKGVEYKGRMYRYAGTQDGQVVFVAGLPTGGHDDASPAA